MPSHRTQTIIRDDRVAKRRHAASERQRLSQMEDYRLRLESWEEDIRRRFEHQRKLENQLRHFLKTSTKVKYGRDYLSKEIDLIELYRNSLSEKDTFLWDRRIVEEVSRHVKFIHNGFVQGIELAQAPLKITFPNKTKK